MRYYKIIIGFLFFFLVCIETKAQLNKADTAQARVYYEQAQKLMIQKKFVQAEVLFVKIFKMNTLLPDEICYHYSKTLFELQKYPQSKIFIEKYIRLQGENGEFYLNSLQLQLDNDKKLDLSTNQECEKIIKDTCHLCRGLGVAMQTCTRCDGHGQIICDLCKGNKVNIETTSFGERYFTCSRCNGVGIITCPVCENTKLEKRKCVNCWGRKFAYYRRKC